MNMNFILSQNALGYNGLRVERALYSGPVPTISQYGNKLCLHQKYDAHMAKIDDGRRAILSQCE